MAARAERARGLWLLAAAVPVAMAISLPAAFTIAAVALVALYTLLKRHPTWASGWAYGGIVIGGLLSVATLSALGQYRMLPDDRRYFLKFWAQAFPPSWHDPVGIARWLYHAHTGPLFAFPHGADLGLAWLTPVIFGCFALGCVLLLRKWKSAAALMVLPALFTLAAAALKRYPYGAGASQSVPRAVDHADGGAGRHAALPRSPRGSFLLARPSWHWHVCWPSTARAGW